MVCSQKTKVRILFTLVIAGLCLAGFERPRLYGQETDADSAAEVNSVAEVDGSDGEPSDGAENVVDSSSVPVDELSLAKKQEVVAGRFKKLEDLLLRSSELEALENPTRASLLQKAAKLGKQQQLADLLARASKDLEADKLSEAIQNQKTSVESLQQLLELLQSENRDKRVREERDQVRRWIEETDRLLRMQGSLRGRTEGGQEAEKAAKDQQRLANKAGEISDDLGGNESESDSGDASTDSKNSSESNSEAGEEDPEESGSEPSGDDSEEGESGENSEEDSDKAALHTMPSHKAAQAGVALV
ncbi:MAG: hypothetical protein AAF483_18810, partial [Planctomycetota bacterium]